MSVSPLDFPAGTANRLDMQYGCYFLFGLATVTVFLRGYVRLFKLGPRQVGLDDAFVLGAWLAAVAVTVGIKLQFSEGFGWHAADIATLPNGAEILTRMIFWPWYSQNLYFFQLGCIKASIVSLYLRLTVVPLHRRILRVALVLVFSQGISSTLAVAAFICNPLSIIWTGSHGGFKGPNCFDILGFNYYNATFHILTDILLAAAPIAVLKNLHMDRKRKVSLAFMFSLGIFAIGGTISRQLLNAMAVNDISDLTWNWPPAGLCSVLECCLGIIFICVPAIAPLFACLGDRPKTGGHQGNIQNDNSTLDTIGHARTCPPFRPYDERFLFETRITALGEADQRSITGDFDHELDNMNNNSVDQRSDRSILGRK